MSFPDLTSLTTHLIVVMPQPAGGTALKVISAVVAGLCLWSIIRIRKNGGVFLIVLVAALASCGMERELNIWQ